MSAQNQETRIYELADLRTRFAALCIDAVILLIFANSVDLSESYLATTVVVGLVYTLFFLTRNAGQTPGKQIMNIRVIKVDGSRFTERDAIARYLGYILNSYLIIGWAWALFDHRYQGWHDKLAHTVVVKCNS